MTALYDQWQAARQLRQSEVVSRRDQVFTDLERWQAERLVHAVQLRQNLDQLMADLRTNTALWLTQTTADREAQILPRQQARQDYIQQLQADTEVLLDNYQADRKLSAAEVRQKLEYDCQVLQNTVSDLRLEIAQELRQVQQQVAEIQAKTAVDLAGYRQEQAMVRAELLPQLTAYVEDLQVQVQATLKELTAVRQQAAVVNQGHRQSDRQALTDSVDAMFDELADFRHQLQAQRAQLSHLVWGGKNTAQPVATPSPRPAVTRPAVTAVPTRAIAAPKPAPKPIAKPAVSNPTVATAPVAAPAPVAPSTPVPAHAAARAVPVATVTAPAAPAAVAVVPVSAPAPETPSLEEVVYNYLHLTQGARLSEIETELGINRFQAVDALRSLIQKDLVIKQDRTYLVQEEAVL
ncbi:hypothetical protein IQ265_08450 [Nodosilinea sp. LEGE 06152]|uniref:SPOR domain-containing protein n=1 Tax=Nodosilinea sp. LEGE 06152 TaxID=2777966 RepID=UPI00187E40F3|nr:hypothetical protein [Nodosilinea sp. LEGE 06152]MBE9156860.1 hypothetical protein [Nodosilinea sp. LEGE 06152]